MIISDGSKIKVYNGTSNPIDANKIVVVKGKRVVLASNTNPDAVEYPLGYTLSSIDSGGYGEVLLEGSIQNINSSSYTDSALLYLNTNGNITTTKPATSIIIGAVITSDALNGSIYFKVFFPKTSWGDITGDITDQTDLQNALDAKFDNPTGDATQYIKGDGTLGTLPSGGGIPHGTATASTENVYTTSITGVTAYNDADAYLIRFTTGNTSTCTLQINTLAAVPLYRNNDGALIGGDIIDGAEMLCVYNSTANRFQVIGTAPNTLLSYVTNAESTSITKGQAVYAFGGQGDRLKVKLASNTTDALSAQTIGVVLSTSIGANQKGLIIMQGQIDGLNLFPTSTWSDGDAVYLGSTAGSFSHTKPTAPNHLVYLGFVTTASNGSAGRMYVRVQNGYEMDELHDVAAQNPNNGDTLQYNTNNSLWETKPIPAGMTWMGAFPG
jgi:hypothetical protein